VTGGVWSITSSTLATGPHALTATQTDAAGNTSAASGPLDLTVGPPPIGPSGPNQFFYFDQNGQFVVLTDGIDSTWGNAGNSTIDGLNGDDFLGAGGDNNHFDAGNGNDTVVALGNHDTISGGKGADFAYAQGNFNVFDGGAGPDTFWANGDGDTISGGQGDDTIGIVGNNSLIDGGAGSNTIYVIGSGDTVTGSGNNSILLVGGNNTLLDSAGVSNDTVTGFNAAAGDRIHLTTDTAANAIAHTTQTNFGLDTVITLADGSTITLKFVSHIDLGFFA
jgi:Ca2+-binding RTX toxin-like protein